MALRNPTKIADRVTYLGCGGPSPGNLQAVLAHLFDYLGFNGDIAVEPVCWGVPVGTLNIYRYSSSRETRYLSFCTGSRGGVAVCWYSVLAGLPFGLGLGWLFRCMMRRVVWCGVRWVGGWRRVGLKVLIRL